MHFIDAWTSLPPLDLIRLLLPAGFLVLAVFVPGRGTARLAALGVALCLPLVRELEVPRTLLVAWVALWVAIAWQAGRVTAGARRSLTTRLAGMEPGTVGLLIGAALLVLLLAAVARQDLAPEESRRVAYAMLLIDLGLLHLMLRRHALRAAVAFGALGLGVQVLDGMARHAEVAAAPPSPGVVLATAIAVAMTVRLAGSRERAAGTAWVSDAHDLRD
jgi:hypothetical protein